jgi:hypothetical protein
VPRDFESKATFGSSRSRRSAASPASPAASGGPLRSDFRAVSQFSGGLGQFAYGSAASAGGTSAAVPAALIASTRTRRSRGRRQERAVPARNRMLWPRRWTRRLVQPPRDNDTSIGLKTGRGGSWSTRSAPVPTLAVGTDTRGNRRSAASLSAAAALARIGPRPAMTMSDGSRRACDPRAASTSPGL